MDENLKQQILLDAYRIAGDKMQEQEKWNESEAKEAADQHRQARVSRVSREEFARREAAKTAAFLFGKSTAATAVEQIWDGQQEKPKGEKKLTGSFQAVVVAVNQEPSSKRFVVDLQPVTGNQVSTNLEYIRTEPEYEEAGQYKGKLVKSLIGHRVTIYKGTESFKGKGGFDQTSKMLAHIEDHGVFKGPIPPGEYTGQIPHPIHGRNQGQSQGGYNAPQPMQSQQVPMSDQGQPGQVPMQAPNPGYQQYSQTPTAPVQNPGYSPQGTQPYMPTQGYVPNQQMPMQPPSQGQQYDPNQRY